MAPLRNSLDSYKRALDHLKNSLKKDLKDPTILAGSIKHFELAYETSWKALKAFLSENLGLQALSPREVFSVAYSQKLIDNEDHWLNLMKDRNFSVHVYDEADARALVDRIVISHLQDLDSLATRLEFPGKA